MSAAHSMTSQAEVTVFECYSYDAGIDIPVFIDTKAYGSDEGMVKMRAQEVFDVLTREKLFPDADSSALDEFKIFPDRCVVKSPTGSYIVKIWLVVAAEVQFGIGNAGPSTDLLGPEIGSWAIGGTPSSKVDQQLQLSLSRAGEPDPMSQLTNQCDLVEAFRKPTVDTSSGRWEFVVDAIGFASDNKTDRLALSATKAILSSETRGIELPSTMYDEFVTRITITNKAVELVNGSLVFKECYAEGGYALGPAKMHLFVALRGQGQVGIQLDASALLRKGATAGSCEVKVTRGSSGDIIFGDSFFQSSLIQFSRTSGLSVCPYAVHYLDGVIPAEQQQYIKDEMMEVSQRTKSSSALLIGLIVGGVVLVGAVVTFFVIRHRKMTRSSDRFAPERPMVEPSDVSSTADIEHF